jgi:hypothetical protein
LPAYDAIGAGEERQALADRRARRLGACTGFGYWAAKRDSPLFLQVMPRGIAVGLHTRF